MSWTCHPVISPNSFIWYLYSACDIDLLTLKPEGGAYLAISQEGKNASGHPPKAKSGTGTCIWNLSLRRGFRDAPMFLILRQAMLFGINTYCAAASRNQWTPLSAKQVSLTLLRITTIPFQERDRNSQSIYHSSEAKRAMSPAHSDCMNHAAIYWAVTWACNLRIGLH